MTIKVIRGSSNAEISYFEEELQLPENYRALVLPQEHLLFWLVREQWLLGLLGDADFLGSVFQDVVFDGPLASERLISRILRSLMELGLTLWDVAMVVVWYVAVDVVLIEKIWRLKRCF